MRQAIFEFQDLTGVKGKLKGPIVRSVSAFDVALRKYRTVSASGDHGALNVWKDDDGNLRGEFMQYMVTKDAQVFKSKAHALKWLRVWIPKLRSQA